MKLIKKINSGSVLVFTLIVLFIGVAAALGIASTTVISQKMAGTTGKSVGSFQVADSGAEIVLQKIYKGGFSTISELGICNTGTKVVSDEISTGKEYQVAFFDDSDPAVQLGCDSNISDIAKIKSTGTYASTSRAVEMAVAAGGEKYQISCTESSSTVICCMINKTTGDVNCKTGVASDKGVEGWNFLSNGSWSHDSGTTTGIYNLSCNLGGGDSFLLHCCRLNSVSNITQCAFYSDETNSYWKTATNPSW